jgi:signal transduction histidine kinase
MFTSVFRKQLAALLGVLLIGFAILAAVLNAVLQDFLVEQKEQLLFREGEQLTELLLEEGDHAPSDQKSGFAKAEAQLKKTLNIRVDLLLAEGGTGTVKWKRDVKRLLKESEIKNQSLLDQVMQGNRITQRGPFSTADEQIVLSVGMPLMQGGKVVGALFLHTPVQEIQTSQVTRLILVTAVLIALPAALLIYVMSRRMTGPLLRMNDAAKRLGEGDFSVRIAAESRDEVSQLAETFNGMAAQLEQLDRMRTELIANVSHELRTPLTSVRGFIQGLLEGVIPEEQRQRYLQIVHSELQRLTTLLNTMLDLSAIETGLVTIEPKPIRWSSLVHTVYESMAPRMEEKGIEFEVIEPEHTVLKAYGDPERLKQVLFNLLDNAIRHTGPGGRIAVRSSFEDGRLTVRVSDNGAGIDPSKLPYIWERFYTEDASRRSHRERSGLGLTITKQLVELMNGTIEVASAVGEGTTFTLHLPVPPDALRPPGSARVAG